MFLRRRPGKAEIARFIASKRAESYSYREVGASRESPPEGYNIDHNRKSLGHGREVFEAAIRAVNDWQMFDMKWVEVFPKGCPIKVGETVAILVSHFGLWSLNAARIVYTIEEDNEVERYGFAYGTLPEHVEQGEERFTVEFHHKTNEVWYDLYAFSKPRHVLAKLGYPLSRRLQKRFARESLGMMKKAVSS